MMSLLQIFFYGFGQQTLVQYTVNQKCEFHLVTVKERQGLCVTLDSQVIKLPSYWWNQKKTFLNNMYVDEKGSEFHEIGICHKKLLKFFNFGVLKWLNFLLIMDHSDKKCYFDLYIFLQIWMMRPSLSIINATGN